MLLISFSDAPHELSLRGSIQNTLLEWFVQLIVCWNKSGSSHSLHSEGVNVLLSVRNQLSIVIYFIYFLFFFVIYFIFTHIFKCMHSHVHSFSIIHLNVLKYSILLVVLSIDTITTSVPCCHINILLPLKISTSTAGVLGVKLTKLLSPNCSKHHHVLYV